MGLHLDLLIPTLMVGFAGMSLFALWLCILLSLRSDAPTATKRNGWLVFVSSWLMFGLSILVLTHPALLGLSEP